MDIREIIRAAGGTVRVARLLGRSHGTVSEWVRVPDKYVLKVASISGIPAYVIRPEVFPAPDATAAGDAPASDGVTSAAHET